MSRRLIGLAVRVTALAVASAAALVPTAARASAAAAYPPPGSVLPDQDPFYRAPADIADYRPGQVVATRPVPHPTLDWIPVPVDVRQIAYRSSDSHGRPELAVTTLVVPEAAWTGRGPRPVVSLQSPEDSLGTRCAPSYLIATGQDNQDAVLGADLLAAGWAVAVPDHEGPKSVFLAGPEEGHVVLDGIRAVRSVGADGIGRANPWALSGYSGGANATGWAAQLQPGYAPDVHLAGAAIGGTPADPAATGRYIDGTAFAGFEFAASYAVAAEWPESGITGLLNRRGRRDYAALKGRCETSILASFAFRRLASDTTVADPFAVPSVAAVLRTDTLGARPPAVPVYDYHADTDEIVPVGQDDALVRAWCREGATVQRVRDVIGEHVEEALVREGSVRAFLAARFAGRPVSRGC